MFSETGSFEKRAALCFFVEWACLRFDVLGAKAGGGEG
jgi:hypothetical protein